MLAQKDTLTLVTQRLDEHHIPYMITGSMAMDYYTVPRMTRDIDVVIELGHDDLAGLIDLFKTDFYLDATAIADAVKHNDMFNLIYLPSMVKIDFIVRKNSAYRKIEFERRQRKTIDGREVWVVSIEDLIISKLFWAKDTLSELQLGDVRHLMATQITKDIAYIEQWVTTLELEHVYAMVQQP